MPDLQDKALEIFRRQGGQCPGGFQFIIPGMALGAEDIHTEFRDGQWTMSYQDGDLVYEGCSEDLVGAYLVLIGNRAGIWNKEGKR